jgi:hypothetical protein
MIYAKTWRMIRSKWHRGFLPIAYGADCVITDELNIFVAGSAP